MNWKLKLKTKLNFRLFYPYFIIESVSPKEKLTRFLTLSKNVPKAVFTDMKIQISNRIGLPKNGKFLTWPLYENLSER